MRFPVFLRTEADHERPLTERLETPAALREAVAQLGPDGIPISGVLLVEFCAEPMREGIWAKMGTFRIGDLVSTDHGVVEDHWCVKTGTYGLSDEAIFEWEHRQVAGNECAAALRPVFEIGQIEYGRADHAVVNGKTVVYEINTNPMLNALHPQRLPIRDETLRIGRARFAGGLFAIDGASGDVVPLVRSPRAQRHEHYGGVSAMQFRP